MSIFSFSLRRISRTQRRTLIAAAAYRSGSLLKDEQRDRWHDFSGKNDVAHSEIIMPPAAAHLSCDRSLLWNTVDR